ncbi:50S ribosomal protein L29 [bacterium]|nr:50S ribosomal protein L29 [bacterium]
MGKEFFVSNKQFKEVRQFSKDELLTKVRETEALLFQSRMQKTTGQLKNTGSVWAARKMLARLKTRLTQLAAGQK